MDEWVYTVHKDNQMIAMFTRKELAETYATELIEKMWGTPVIEIRNTNLEAFISILEEIKDGAE